MKTVYVHKRKTNNEAFYVGAGNLDRPFILKKRTQEWKDIVNEHGLIIEILEENLSVEDVKEKEELWIQHFRNIGSRLINKRKGGGGISNLTVEQRKKVSEKVSALRKDRIWVNNGIIDRHCYEDQIPEGFVKGRICHPTRGKKMSLAHKSKVSEKFKSLVWINNGTINKRVRPDAIPDGFTRGYIRRCTH